MATDDLIAKYKSPCQPLNGSIINRKNAMQASEHHVLDGDSAKSIDSILVTIRPQTNIIEKLLSSHKPDAPVSWGRWAGGSWEVTAGCAAITCLCPLLTMFLYVTMQDFDSSLSASLTTLWSLGPKSFAGRYGLRSSGFGFFGFVAWTLLQAALYTFLPTKLSSGQLTPAGYVLQYRTNGLLAWSLTVILALLLVFTGVVDPAILATHWESLLIAANAYGCVLSVLAYLKAFVAPSHAEDRKFSGQNPEDPA